MQLTTFISKTVETITVILEGLVGILMIFLLCIVSGEIILRFVFNSPTSWSSELARFVLIWLTFTGASIATKRSLHLTMGFNIYRFINTKKVKAIKITVNTIILLTMSLIFYFSTKVIFLSGARMAPMTKIPMYLPWAAIPFNAVIIVGYILERSIRILTDNAYDGELS